MATPARARRRRGLIGPVGLVALVTVFGAATAAVAFRPIPADAAPSVSVTTNPGTVALKVGGDQATLNVGVTVTEPVRDARVQIGVPLGEKGVTVKGYPGGCQNTDGNVYCDLGPLQPNQPKQVPITIAPPGGQGDLQPGSSTSGTGQIQVQADGAQGAGSYQVTLTNDKPDSVGSVSGSVADDDGKPVPNAKVKITDTAGHTEQVNTDSGGEYSWSASDDHILKPGEITVAVSADGYKSKTTTLAGNAGQPLTFGPITLSKVASAKPTHSAPATSAAPTHHAAAEKKDSGGMSWVVWLLIILGSLLVVGGVIAIILLLRKKDDADDDDGPGPLLPFDDRPSGAGYPGGDPSATTVMAPVPGNDTPTVVHNGPLVRDEYDDYDNFARNYGTNGYQAGAPSTPYAGETQVYGAQPPSGGGATQQYGATTQQYGGPAGATQQYGGPPPGSGQHAQPWQQSDSGRSEGTMYGRTSHGGAAPTSGGAHATGQYGPTSGGAPGYGPTSGGAPGYGPTSGGAPGYGPPAGSGAHGQPPTSGAPSPYGQQPGGGGYGQQPPARHGVDDPTRTWQGQRQQQQPSPQRHARPGGDETRLDRNDGVDWLDG